MYENALVWLGFFYSMRLLAAAGVFLLYDQQQIRFDFFIFFT